MGMAMHEKQESVHKDLLFVALTRINEGVNHQREQSVDAFAAQNPDAHQPKVQQLDVKPTQPQNDKPKNEMEQASETYHALSNNPSKQAAFLNQMADTVAKNIGGDRAAVADILQQRFESYHTAQHTQVAELQR